MTNKFDAQKNDDRAPKECNNNSHRCLTCGIMALPFHGFNLWYIKCQHRFGIILDCGAKNYDKT